MKAPIAFTALMMSIGTSAFADSNVPFEQTQFDRNLAATDAPLPSAYQKGSANGAGAGSSQPGSHHNLQQPAKPPAAAAPREVVAEEKYPLQPVPDPYIPQ